MLFRARPREIPIGVRLSAITLQELRGSLDIVLSSPRLKVSTAVVKSTVKVELGLNTINTMSRVDVLNHGDLEASSTALAGDDGGVGKEELPDAEPPFAVLGLDLVPVVHPVAVPSPESSRVVNTDGIDMLDLETSTLELVDNPAERSRSVSAREDVLVHEETPGQILVLPSLADTGVLKEENTIVVKHVVNLLKEAREVTNTNVLRHLKRGNLLVAANGNGNISVVLANNSALLLGDTNLAHAAVAPSGLVTAESDTSDVGTVLLASEAGKGTPTTANIEHRVALGETNLLANNGEFVVLELLKSLLAVDVRDDTGGVDHARAKEPAVEIITTVVVVADLLLVWQMLVGFVTRLSERIHTLRTSVHDNLGHHAKQEELDKANGKAEANPVVALLHDLKAVTLEVNIAVKVHFVESLHRNLVGATVLGTIGLLLEFEVVLDTTVGKANLLILAGADGGNGQPPGSEHGKIDNDGEEQGGLEATTDLPAEPPGDDGQDRDEDIVVEGVRTRAIGGKRSVLDGWVLRGWLLDDILQKRHEEDSNRACMHDIKTYPGSRNTNVLKLVKVRLGKGGSFNELEVEAGYA